MAASLREEAFKGRHGNGDGDGDVKLATGKRRKGLRRLQTRMFSAEAGGGGADEAAGGGVAD